MYRVLLKSMDWDAPKLYATRGGAAAKPLIHENKPRTGLIGNLPDRPPRYNATPAEFGGFTGFLSASCDLFGTLREPALPTIFNQLPIPGFNWQVRYMSSLDKREEGFEKKFALDEEQKFKAEARRNKLLGLWAAEKLGLTGDAAASYAKEVVAADFEVSGDSDVLGKVSRDLADKGVSEQQIRVKMDELVAVAVSQIKAGG
jgi:hypothetical protein